MPTGNTQQVINYGASANDGQGDPLRTAFIKTDDNFDNVWLAGPVGSNVRITNNTIGVIDTNGNLILSPNGVGVIQTNNNIVPRLNRTYDLGTANLTYRTVYANTATFQTLGLTGDLSVGGNLTVSGNIIQVGNIVTETLTIQLANAAITANAANGSGITVGASDNIATLLYNSTGNVWTTNIGVSAIGNVTAPYFIGNGSQLTGLAPIYGNANVVANLAALGTNPITTTGNITGGRILGNGSGLTNLPAPTVTQDITSNGAMSIMLYDGIIKYNNYATVEPSSGNIRGGNISAIGNISGNYFIGNGSQLTGVAATGNLDISGTVIDIAAGAPDTLINITPSGPTGGWAFLQLPTNDTANTANTRLHNDAGNVEIGTGDFSTGSTNYTWTFDATGNLNLAANGDLNFSAGGIVQAIDEDFRIRVQDADDDGFALLQEVDDGAGNVLGLTQLQRDRFVVEFAGGGAPQFRFTENGQMELPGNVRWDTYQDQSLYAVADNNSAGTIELKTISFSNDTLGSNIRVTQNNATISTGNAAHTWNFDNTGNLNLPASGHLVGTTANNSGFIAWVGNSSGDLNGYTTMGLIPDDTVVNSDQYIILDPTAPGHIHIRAGGTQDNSGADLFLGGENSYFRVASGANSAASVSANSYVWTYGTDGTFSLPAAESPGQYSEITSVGNSSGDGNGYATLQLKPDSNVGGDSYLIIDPTAPNHIHIRAGGAQDNSGAQLFLGGENSYFLVENGANSNVYVASNSNQWKFDTTGVVTLPGEGVLQSLNDTVTLRSLNTTSGNANSVYLGSSGGLGFNDQEIGGNWLEIFRNGAEPEIRVPVGLGNLNIQTAEGANAYNWTFDNTGNLTVPGNIVMPPFSSLVGTGASPAPSISGFSNGGFGGNVSVTGNITGGNLSVTGNITGNTAGFAIGYRDIPQVSFAGNATIATTDAGKHFYSTQSSNFTLTIANNASQGFQVGAAITVVNQGTGTITIAQGSGVTLYIAGNSTSGNRSVATFGMATIMKVAADTWFINGTGVS